VAGAVLSHRGFRVLVAGVPTEERYSVGPYMLPHAPLAFVGLESPALKRVVSELNLVQLLRRRLEPNRPAFQVILPEHRLNVGDDVGREVARELPSAVGELEQASARLAEVSAQLESILAQDLILPPDGFWDRRDANRVGARLPEDELDVEAPLAADHPLRALSRLPATFGSDLAEVGVVGRARLADLYRRGTFRIDGGRQGLRALLVERLRTHSGEVRPELVPKSILVKRGRVTGIAFEGRSEIIGCNHLLCGMGADKVAALIEGDKPPRRLLDAAALRPAYHRYLVHLVAPIDALPDALGLCAFAARDLGAPLEGANALALHLTDGYGQHAVLSVETLAKDPSPGALAELRRGVLDHINAIFPFVERHLLLVHSPHDGIPVERGDGNLTAPPPVAMDPVWEVAGPRSLGVGGLPHATGVKNLLFVSRQVLPGLGIEGELAAGWGAARIVLSREHKRDLVKGAVLEGT
jgi:hypothetical protein